jgi:hypothetical protein
VRSHDLTGLVERETEVFDAGDVRASVLGKLVPLYAHVQLLLFF